MGWTADDGQRQKSMQRYARQMRLSQIGEAGQHRLAKARVAVVGMGALGCASAEWLARAGVGYMRLIDRDVVEWSNLSRQLLFAEEDAEAVEPKAAAAAKRLSRINRAVVYDPIVDDFDRHNALLHLADVDIIIDGTDNYEARRLINDVSVRGGVPWAYAGAVGTYGSTALFRPGETPCFACLFPEADVIAYDTCDTVGVFGPAIGVLASLQAAAVMRYLLGHEDKLAGITTVDVWSNDYYTVSFGPAKADCRCCGERQFDALNSAGSGLTVSMCGRDTVQIRPQQASADRQIDLAAVGGRLRAFGLVQVTSHLLRFVDGDEGFYLFPNGRALVFGVADVRRARAIYARYIGM